MKIIWIFLLVCSQGVLCAEECSYTIGASTITRLCTGDKYCCNDNTECCSKLSTGAIIAFAAGGAVFLGLIIMLIVYAIVKNKKKKSSVTPVQSASSAMPDQPPPYTPRVLTNHYPPEYEAQPSGSTYMSIGHAPTQQSERKMPL